MANRLKLIDTIEGVPGRHLTKRIEEIFVLGYEVKVDPYYNESSPGPFGGKEGQHVRYRLRIYKEVKK